MAQLKIIPAQFKFIEFELYRYDETKEQIEAIKEEIIGTATPTLKADKDRIQPTEISDPTCRKAVLLTTNVTLQYMERTVKGIERALMRLDEIHNEIFEQRYRQNKTWRQTLSELYIGQDTYFKKRREIITAVGAELGLFNPEW